MTLVLLILPCRLSGLTGEYAFGGTMEFLARFIQTDLGALRITNLANQLLSVSAEIN
jgi:hypothetical protein